MIHAPSVLADTKRLVTRLVDDLRARSEEVDEVRNVTRAQYTQARSAGRTERAYEDWREDLFDQVAVAWVLSSVFVRFCEDNRLVDTPLLSGPSERRTLAQDHRTVWFKNNPTAGDREWLVEVFSRYAKLPGMREVFAERNALWLFGPSADGARAILELWWRLDEATGELIHNFTDPDWDTRFLGDLYQDLSEHAKKTYALLQTPEFVEEFILSRTLHPAIETFGLDEVRMIDPACGSGHFLLGAFKSIFTRWQDREPATSSRELAQRTLDAINGVDLNPFAVAIARFRLLVVALKVSGVTALEDAPDFHVNVAVGDSLLHGTRPSQLLSLTAGLDPVLHHRYPTEDEDLAREILTGNRYHAVVGNPPYITVKDPALNQAYRSRYATCFKQYSLAVPFSERFFDLALVPEDGDAGYVGMITSNSFMKREFGKKLIEDFLPTKDLTHVIDTSGAYIPGHGTPTLILFARNQRPTSDTVRAVLGIRGEPSIPLSPEKGNVWKSITSLVDKRGAESSFTSVVDLPRNSFRNHPWSLQGGGALALLDVLEQASRKLGDVEGILIGYTGQTNADEVFVAEPRVFRRKEIANDASIPWVVGEVIRDWTVNPISAAIYPYRNGALTNVSELDQGTEKHLWTMKTMLLARRTFSKRSYAEEGRAMHEWHQIAPGRLGRPALCAPYVASHNHFALGRSGWAFNSTAPFVQCEYDEAPEVLNSLLSLLNSSVACFWMRNRFHDKGNRGTGGGIVDEPWERFFVLDGTKLAGFPLPEASAAERAQRLVDLGEAFLANLPDSIIEREGPAATTLSQARSHLEVIGSQMVALQEELDWQCYQLYDLLDEDLTYSLDKLPEISKGERSFEIVLARKMGAGELESTWFERHGSTPITELPSHWPEDYKHLVERRIELIEADRFINLLERPEYKRRWNWESWEQLEQRALKTWLLDRLETKELWETPEPTTCARLADQFAGDAEFLEVSRLYVGHAQIDLTALITTLVLAEAVPYLASLRYKQSGMRKRAVWEKVWALQRREDEIDSRTTLPADHPDYLTEAETKRHKEREVGAIPVPPKYTSADFTKTTFWRLRGKLDVPRERFIIYPNTSRGADTTPLIGWAGWDHLQRARALAAHYTTRRDESADAAELLPLLAGLYELTPWLMQWHNEVDTTYGQRLGEFFASFVESEDRSLGKTTDDLTDYAPLAPWSHR